MPTLVAVLIIDNHMTKFDEQNIIEHEHENTVNILNAYLHCT